VKGADRLNYFYKYWPTDKGAWKPGEQVFFREKSLLDDFTDKSWMTLLLYGIGGRILTESESSVIEKIWSLSSSFPDPRLWNNRIAALAGTSRSTGAMGIAAATAITEAKVYGSRPVYLGAAFLHDLKKLKDQNLDLEKHIIERLRKERFLPGFGRPITSEDERIKPLLRELAHLGYQGGEFLALINDIIQILEHKRYRLKPNIAIYCSAVFSDLGFDPYQSYLIAVLAFSAGMFPCYIDALEKPEGTLFPLACTDIEYTGPATRPFPD
jgi:citrate synthase